MYDYNALSVYVDGSSSSSPRKGGVGIRIIFPESLNMDQQVLDIQPPGYKGATNNQMEIQACILALRKIKLFSEIKGIGRIILYTDSSYVADNYKSAIFVWPKNKWLKSSGEPILNAGLWKDLTKAIRDVKTHVDICWVKGHAKNEHNKAVDKIAKKSSSQLLQSALAIVNVRRKKSPKNYMRGSVKMLGQRISIRIITSEYLNIQRTYKYKYEVTSKKSTYYQNVDIIYSTLNLRQGHTFIVCFNRDNANPRVLRIVSDITEKKTEQ